MPNWCSNIVVFENKNDLRRVLKLMKTDENLFDFRQILPVPAGEQPHSLDWRVENWGTKWLPDPINENLGGDFISFDTAWETPKKVYEKLAQVMPDLKFKVNFSEPEEEIEGSFEAPGDGTLTEGDHLSLCLTPYLGPRPTDETRRGVRELRDYNTRSMLTSFLLYTILDAGIEDGEQLKKTISALPFSDPLRNTLLYLIDEYSFEWLQEDALDTTIDERLGFLLNNLNNLREEANPTIDDLNSISTENTNLLQLGLLDLLGDANNSESGWTVVDLKARKEEFLQLALKQKSKFSYIANGGSRFAQEGEAWKLEIQGYLLNANVRIDTAPLFQWFEDNASLLANRIHLKDQNELSLYRAPRTREIRFPRGIDAEGPRFVEAKNAVFGESEVTSLFPIAAKMLCDNLAEGGKALITAGLSGPNPSDTDYKLMVNAGLLEAVIRYIPSENSVNPKITSFTLLVISKNNDNVKLIDISEVWDPLEMSTANVRKAISKIRAMLEDPNCLYSMEDLAELDYHFDPAYLLIIRNWDEAVTNLEETHAQIRPSRLDRHHDRTINFEDFLTDRDTGLQYVRSSDVRDGIRLESSTYIDEDLIEKRREETREEAREKPMRMAARSNRPRRERNESADVLIVDDSDSSSIQAALACLDPEKRYCFADDVVRISNTKDNLDLERLVSFLNSTKGQQVLKETYRRSRSAEESKTIERFAGQLLSMPIPVSCVNHTDENQDQSLTEQ